MKNVVFDPAVFDPSRVGEEAGAIVKLVEAALAGVPPVNEVEPSVTREQREKGEGVFRSPELLEEARVRTIPGPDGELTLRMFVPDEPLGAFLHIHGGGWVLGGAHLQDPLLKLVSDACRLAVVSVGYRLAPEHPYPAGPDDCEAAALWLVNEGREEIGVEKLLIGGESAGAHLSAVTLLRLRDRHGLTPFSGANLTYGCYDLRKTPSVRSWGTRNLILNTPIIEWFSDQFVPESRRGEPDVSPLYADLRDLPPALFTVGTMDPLIDDTLFMYGRWVAASNKAELAIYPGSIHGFHLFPGVATRLSLEQQVSFLKAALQSD
jgi:acetyl esterase/lipase